MNIKSLLVGAVFVVGLLTAAIANETKVAVGEMVISNQYIRATPPNAKVAAGYLTIENTGGEADRLIGGDVAFAGKVEVHEMKMTAGVMKMRELADGLVIGPGETVTLKSGAEHLMFMKLREQMTEGGMHTVKLVFEKAGEVEIMFPVGGLSGSHSGHTH